MNELSAESIPAGEDVSVPNHINFTANLPAYKPIRGCTIERVRPINSTKNNGPYIFNLPANFQSYLQTAFIVITGKMRIVKPGGIEMTEADKTCVAPIEYWGQAWIKNIVLKAGGAIISSGPDQNYHLKVMTNTLLNYDVNCADSHLRCSGFSKEEKPSDEVDDMRAKWDTVEGSPSLTSNEQKFKNSKWVNFASDLQIDMLKTNRDFPNGVKLGLIFHRNDAAYLLMRGVKDPDADPNALDTTNYNYEIDDLQLHIRRIAPSDKVMLWNNNQLTKTNLAKYQFYRWQLYSETLRAGVTVHTSQTVFTEVPGRVVYFFLDNRAYTGDFNKNPNIFKHWNIKKFIQRLGGTPAPIDDLEFDWDNDNIAEAYKYFIDACGINTMNRTNLITYDMYKKTRFMIVMDNNPEGIHFDIGRTKPKDLAVSVNITFHKPLPVDVEFIAYGIFDDVLVIDEKRNLSVESQKKT